jgi:DNA-binding NtrC family response regulator
MKPTILIIDDLFGRNVNKRRNVDRENLCTLFHLHDITEDAAALSNQHKPLQPTANAVFYRGQSPDPADVGQEVWNNLEESLSVIRRGWSGPLREGSPPWSMVLLDLCFYTGPVTENSDEQTPGMPEGSPGDDDPKSYFGLTLLDAIHREIPELPVFILSSKPRDDVSLEFSRRGALGFIDRTDVNAPEQLEAALWHHGLLPDPWGEVVGNSLPLLLSLREARRAAGHGENILIRGERGTGKELMARYLNRSAALDNKERPFVTVNSAVFTPNLFSSEMFGIEPRTATGVDGKIGLIESAKEGDLFLDEIADMPSEVQAAALRVLQERQITRVGGRKVIPLNVRFLSATNANIEDEARGFRLDLLDRLRLGGTIWLPLLKERTADIPLLVEKFVREAETQRPGIRQRQVTPEAMETLKHHHWPGNIRELRMVIFDAVNRHSDVEYLVPSHLRLAASNTGNITQNNTLSENENQTVEINSLPRTSVDSFDNFLRQCNAIDFGSIDASKWAGRLTELQASQAQVVARMVQAAINATKRRTSDNPAGQIQIHPAFKLLTGDKTLTASKAADLAKKLLGPIADELTGDLAEAYHIAIRLRPKSSGPSKKR